MKLSQNRCLFVVWRGRCLPGYLHDSFTAASRICGTGSHEQPSMCALPYSTEEVHVTHTLRAENFNHMQRRKVWFQIKTFRVGSYIVTAHRTAVQNQSNWPVSQPTSISSQVLKTINVWFSRLTAQTGELYFSCSYTIEVLSYKNEIKWTCTAYVKIIKEDTHYLFVLLHGLKSYSRGEPCRWNRMFIFKSLKLLYFST